MIDLTKQNEIPDILPRKKLLKPYVYLLWAFFIPSALLLAIYFFLGVFPVSNNSVLVLDLNAQYVYFYEELRDVLLGEGNLLYSWQRALGGEFMGIFAYYIASPFNFIVALFPEGYITESLLTIFVLKAGLAGFNFALFLDLSKRKVTKTASVIFGTMYALCSYAITNNHNSMWLDALLFLPILIYALEKLINEKKYILYTIMLAVIVMANFYIGYMVCLFVIIYFFYYYFVFGKCDEYNLTNEKRHFVFSALRVLLFSLLAIGISAVILLTTYYSLTFGKTDFTNPDFTPTQQFDFFDLLAKFLPNSYDTVRPEGLPWVYSGTLVIILLPLFFINKKIKLREKIGGGVVVALFVVIMNLSTLDMVWHGFQAPNWLNYRYSFMFIFFMLVLCHEAFEKLDGVGCGTIAAVCGIAVLVVLLIQKEDYEYIGDFDCIWFSLIALGVYLLALLAIKKERTPPLASLILAVIVSTEMLLNGYITLVDLDEDVVISSRDSYRNYLDTVSPVVEKVQENDTSFYRMEMANHRKPCDNFALNINGITNSTSTLNESIIEFLNRIGYSSHSHWSKYIGGSALSDALLGIKYVIYSDEYKGNVMEKIDETDEYTTYINPYALSVAYAVNHEFEYLDFEEYDTPFELLNDMVTAMLGENRLVKVFKPVYDVEYTVSNASESFATDDYLKYVPVNDNLQARITYTVNAKTENEIFFFYPSDYPREVAIQLNSKDYGTFFGNESDCLKSLGCFDEDETISLTVTLKEENLYILNDKDYFWYLDKEVLEDVMTRLAQNQFVIDEYSDTHLKGNITVSEGNDLLFTSIPYDKGWHVYVDGVEMPVIKTADSLLAVDIGAGEHTLEFKYMPKEFVAGAAISLGSVLIFAAIIYTDIIMKKRRLKNKKIPDTVFEPPLDILSDEPNEEEPYVPLPELPNDILSNEETEQNTEADSTSHGISNDTPNEQNEENK